VRLYKDGKILPVLLFIMLVAVVLLWFTGSHTFIRTDNDIFWISKDELTFKDVYVDVTHWGLNDYLKNPKITTALITHGYQNAKEKLTGQQDTPSREKIEDIYNGMAESYEDSKDAIHETVTDIKEKTATMSHDLKERIGK